MEHMTPLPTITIEFIPDTEASGWTAHVPDVPAYGEGGTQEEALEDLKIGLQAFIEENGMDATIARLQQAPARRTVNFGELVSHR
jgi:predicted RNase H-like HicB family nuclease